MSLAPDRSRPSSPARAALLAAAGIAAAGFAVASFAVASFAVAGLTVETPAQAPPEVPAPFGERVEVEVVNVDVVVTARDDRRVTDLGRGDFELLVDGQPVTVEYFVGPPAAPERGAPPPPGLEPQAVEPLPAPAEAAPPPALLVVFVDQSALERRVRRDTLAELREFVSTRQPDERVMVAAFETHLRLFAAPTADAAAIEAAFAALENLPSHGALTTNERTRLEHEVRAFGRMLPMLRGSGSASAGERVRRYKETEGARLRAEVEQWGEQELDRQHRSVRAMAQIVAALGALPGRKATVVATAGFNSEPARFLLQFLAQKTTSLDAASTMSRAFRLDELGVRLGADFEELVRAAQNARVAFYTVQPRDPPPSHNSAEFASAGADESKPPPRDFTSVELGSSVTRLAAATGGRTFVLDGGLDSRLEQVRDDVRAVYSLGFTTGPAAGERDHRIEVRVRREGLDVHHRESFRRRTSEERQEEALMAAATLGEVANGAGLVLELGAPVPAAKRRKGAVVPIAVRIPLASVTLLPDGQMRRGRLKVRVAVYDADGKVISSNGTPIEIDIPEADAERALAQVWVHRAEMRLLPGRHRVAVLVADEGGGVATVAAAVEIAAP